MVHAGSRTPEIFESRFPSERLTARPRSHALSLVGIDLVLCLYIYKEFKHIIYEKVYSSDTFLDLNFIDENGNKIKSRKKVTIVLSIKE